MNGAVAIGDVRMLNQGLFEGIERDALVTAFDDAVGTTEQLQVFIDKVAGFQPAVRPRAIDVQDAIRITADRNAG